MWHKSDILHQSNWHSCKIIHTVKVIQLWHIKHNQYDTGVTYYTVKVTQKWHITQSKWHSHEILQSKWHRYWQSCEILHTVKVTQILTKFYCGGQLEFVTVKMTHFCDILHSQCDTRVTYYTSQSDTIVEQYTQSKWQSWIIST